jgi:hypothetical protein
MSSHEEHHHDKPKRVYFGIPFAFAFTFWLVIFLMLKACDGPKDNGCCKEGKECSKECMEKCKAEEKEGCHEKEGVSEEKKEDNKEEATEEKSEKEEKSAAEEKH